VSFRLFLLSGREGWEGVSVRRREALVQGAASGFCWQTFDSPHGEEKGCQFFYFEEIRVFKASHLGYE